MIKDNSKFNFFIPAEFVKGGRGGKEMYIKGIASAEVEDSDGETLVPAGYDVSPLLESGFLNYNHQASKDPEAIIGQPTKAEIVNNGKGLYIEGFLYPDSIAAQKTYKLAQVLEKNSPDRRMGFSIEGKALERDPINPKRITKARITGVAITPCPKNPNTLLSIMKGEYTEPFVEVDEELEKGGPGSGRKPGLQVHYTKDNKKYSGKITSIKPSGRYTVESSNENGKIQHDVHEDEIDKAMTAAGGEGVTQTEDIDEGKKVFEKLLEDKNLPKNANLKKSEAYSLILSKYSDFFGSDIEKAKQIFSLVKEFNTKLYGMEDTNKEIMTDALEKAFSLIDEKIDEIKKAKTESEVEKEDDKSTEEVVDKKDESDEEKDVEKSEADLDIEKGVKEEFKIQETPVGNGTYGGVDTYLKTLIKSSFEKGMSSSEIVLDMISKGCDEEFATNLVKSVEDEMSKLHANGGLTEVGLKTEEKEVSQTTHSTHASDNSFAKSEDVDLVKSELVSIFEERQNRLIEGIEQRFHSLSTILKSYNNDFTSIKEATKGLKEENTSLKKSLAEANQRIEKFASTPQRAKSVTSTRQIERFDNIEKSEGNKDTYSLSSKEQVRELTQRLTSEFESTIQKGQVNKPLEKAILELSFAGDIQGESIVGIRNVLDNLNIEITK